MTDNVTFTVNTKFFAAIGSVLLAGIIGWAGTTIYTNSISLAQINVKLDQMSNAKGERDRIEDHAATERKRLEGRIDTQWKVWKETLQEHEHPTVHSH